MADYNTEQFEKDCKALGVTLSAGQIEQFLKYYEMLVEWNEVMNLTAITEYDEVMKKHFVDSISLCKAYDVMQKKTVIDVGTGATEELRPDKARKHKALCFSHWLSPTFDR